MFEAGKNANRETNGIETWNYSIDGVSPPSGAAQGVWKRIGPRRFIADQEAFCFDTFRRALAPAGYVNAKAVITLNES